MEICQELDSQEWNFSQVFTDVDPIWGTSQDIQATIAKVIDLVSHREACEKKQHKPLMKRLTFKRTLNMGRQTLLQREGALSTLC